MSTAPSPAPMAAGRIHLGISACLLGQPVRYDGGHKREPWLADHLNRWVTWLPVCPEAECGLGIPREPMRLEGDPRAPRLIAIASRRDLTAPLQAWAGQRIRKLTAQGIAGFIGKCRSPSCGVTGIPCCDAAGTAITGAGAGLFIRLLSTALPDLPIVEERELAEAEDRASFLAGINLLAPLAAPTP